MAYKGARARAAERRLNALRLRKAGASYSQIAKALGCSKTQAYRDIQRALKNIGKREQEGAAELRLLESQRLDELLMPMMRQAKNGSQGAVDRVLRIMERRAKLWGIDAPERAEVRMPDGVDVRTKVEIETDDDRAAEVLRILAEAGALEAPPEAPDGAKVE
jgi:transposase